jgi:hypothetical protein
MSYTVIRRLRHDETRYQPGDSISGLNKADAKRLLDLGVIESDEAPKPAKKSATEAKETKQVSVAEAPPAASSTELPPGINPQLTGK